MSVTSSVVKTSVSLKSANRKKLEKEKNRSAIINKAVELYFQKEKYMNDMEEKRLHTMAEEWLRDVKEGSVYPLNRGKKITQKDLDKLLR